MGSRRSRQERMKEAIEEHDCGRLPYVSAASSLYLSRLCCHESSEERRRVDIGIDMRWVKH